MHVNKILYLSVALLTSLSVYAQSDTAPLPFGMPMPLQSPPGANSLQGQSLTYRDPAKPLTIEEVSALEVKKSNADLYRKFGLTDAEPLKMLVTRSPKVEFVRQKIIVETIAVWGSGNSFYADVFVNGVLQHIRGGESLVNGVVVTSVHPKGLFLTITPSSPPIEKNQKAGSRRANATKFVQPPSPVSEQVWAIVGSKKEVTL